eukprot:TRINITY_DN23531_c0_g1_i1.p1 TRINITY_DN23531_c0_g1~~TRINITY_DN23531_c0_g1_i1.p1  ORF type:complete len:712 (-),score=75.94 TRINITY_DN23531_c0_g1_i1:327-2462(-)
MMDASISSLEVELPGNVPLSSVGHTEHDFLHRRVSLVVVVTFSSIACLAGLLAICGPQAHKLDSAWQLLHSSAHEVSFLAPGVGAPRASDPWGRLARHRVALAPVASAVPTVPAVYRFLGSAGASGRSGRLIPRVPVGNASSRNQNHEWRATRNSTEAEAKLIEILSEDCPKKVWSHLMAERSSFAATSVGDPSVPALLDFLEEVEPPPVEFDKRWLKGDWLLEYTSDLPLPLEQMLTANVEEATTDISAILSIGKDGSMQQKFTISLRDGRKEAVTLQSFTSQILGTPYFAVFDEYRNIAESAVMSVTFLSDGLLIIRKDIESILDDVSGGLETGYMRPKTDLWRKIEQPPVKTWSVARPTHDAEVNAIRLWRFQLIRPTLVSSPPGFFTGKTSQSLVNPQAQESEGEVVDTRGTSKAWNDNANGSSDTEQNTPMISDAWCNKVAEGEVSEDTLNVLVRQEPYWLRYTPMNDVGIEQKMDRFRKELEDDEAKTWDPTLYPYHPKIHTLGNRGLLGSLDAEISPVFSAMLDKLVDGMDARQEVLRAIPKNQTVLDVGCGTGYSTSSNPGSLGIDTSAHMLGMAKRLFPRKRFIQAQAETYDPFLEYDVITIMYLFHEAPQVARLKMLRNLIPYARQKVVIVDICPTYTPSRSMLAREPYIHDYLETIRDDLKDFKEEVLVENHVHMWTLDTQINDRQTDSSNPFSDVGVQQ